MLKSREPIASVKSLASFLLASTFATTLWIPPIPAVAEKQIASPREFSGTLIKQVNGKKHQAQVFAKGDRFRLEYKYALRTDYGYAAIEIIRMVPLGSLVCAGATEGVTGHAARSGRCAADAADPSREARHGSAKQRL